MMLSSTIRTLIGGTAPSRRPAGSFSALSLGLRGPFVVAFNGRGEEARGGGVLDRRGSSFAIAGDGMGGGAGMPLA